MSDGRPSPGAAPTDETTAAPAATREIRTYDEIQTSAPLLECSRCHRSLYMTKPNPLCIECRQAAAREAGRLAGLALSYGPLGLYASAVVGAIVGILRQRPTLDELHRWEGEGGRCSA